MKDHLYLHIYRSNSNLVGITMLFLSIFIFLQLFCLINCKGPSLYCPPEWVVHGSGDIPEDAEMCSLGGGEYIGRTFQNGEWVAGT